MSAEVGYFGVILGFGTIGGASKDKILEADKGVKEKVSGFGKKIHANDLNYVGDTHVYSIHRLSDGKAMKVGESTQGVRKMDGTSKRAETQARQFRKETGEEYYTKIRNEFGNKKDAKIYENKLIVKTRHIKGDKSLPKNKTTH